MLKKAIISKKNFDAVILDLDGVITSTATTHARAWKMMFDSYLIERSERTGEQFYPMDIHQDYLQYIDGRSRYDGADAFLKSRNIHIGFGSPDDPPGNETVCGLANQKNNLYHLLLDKEGVTVFKDTVSRILEWRQQGIYTGVISASKNCREVLKAAELLNLFDIIIDGNVAEKFDIKGKPAPDMFLFALYRLEIPPSRAAMVEDAIAGIKAGKAGKFKCAIGIARQGNKDDLYNAGADIVVSSMDEISSVEQDIISLTPKKLPSALQEFQSITQTLKNRKCMLCLDYDGTLTPIVGKPEDAKLSDEMRSAIDQLSSKMTVSIISGRDREEVQKLVGLGNLFYAGSHGFDIHGPNGIDLIHSEAQRCLPSLDKAEVALRELSDIQGILIERKKFAIAIHYRLVDVKYFPDIESKARQLASHYHDLRMTLGKKIFELRPNVDWHKGKAVTWLKQKLLPNVTSGIIYLGDDITDEDAFKELLLTGDIGILIGDHKENTMARYQLNDIQEVYTFLEKLKNAF